MVTTDIEVRGEVADLIEGGAARGGNLFHSFSDFNVLEAERVYFANPDGIESILSRVTGASPSLIFGTLGIDGSADLFLINPNGLVFGENAALDVEGSFYGTTAEAAELGDGVFSAVAPEQSQLLVVNPSAVFWNYLTENSGDVVTRGQIAVGGDLVLSGGNLDLQGTLAGAGDVSFLAVDTVQIRDAAEAPFVTLAGGDLLVQGNERVDIVALSHPESRLFSYGNMVLRSVEQVGGDAHYWSGGDFRVERLDGSGGALFSPNDPIIRSQGDVSFFIYQGASLHILAGGAVDIGSVIITGPDTTGTAISPDSTPELSNVTLSDGTTLIIDGSSRPTLDVRAGMDPKAVGIPLGTVGEASGIFGDTSLALTLPPDNNPIATSANISIGDIIYNNSDGLALLTNNYNPNSYLSEGDIAINDNGLFGFGSNAAEVFIDSRNNIILNNITVTASSIIDPASGDYADNGGDVTLLSGDNIILNEGIIMSWGLLGGRISLTANNNILVRGSGLGGGINNISFSSMSGITGGEIRLNARSLYLSNGSEIGSFTAGNANAGNVSINVEETVSLEGFDDDTLGSVIRSQVLEGASGNAGNIGIDTRNLFVLDGAQISAASLGDGNGGDLTVRAELTELKGDGTDPDGAQINSSLNSTSAPETIGNAGNIIVSTNQLFLVEGGQISVATFSDGEAGALIVQAESVQVIGTGENEPSTLLATTTRSASGDGGNLRIETERLRVVDGGQISASTAGLGDGGNLEIIATEIELAGIGTTEDDTWVSGLFSSAVSNSVGTAGSLIIEVGDLRVTDEAQVSTSTRGEGKGGALIISADNLYINDAAIISNSLSQGNAGNITLNVSNQLEIIDGSIATNSTFSSGGQIQINAGVLRLFGDSDILTFVNFGSNNGGDISIIATALVALSDSDILAFSADGRGGDVDLSRTAFFGQNFQLAPPGTDPRTLEGNSRVDINATGALASGTISLADVSIVENSLSELPDNLVNPETLVASSCIARSNDASGTFTVTGRDSLPQQPDNPEVTYHLSTVQPIPNGAHEITNTIIVEPRGVYRLADGRLVMSRECNR